MKISHNWLQEFVDIRLRPEELSEALNMLGIEVEGFEDRRSMYDGFVIAEVRTKEKHPKADKLSVCTVFDGTELRTVVCGAPNVDAGQTIVLARPGARVPRDGFEIGTRSLRGVESQGMICSKAELLLPEDVDGIWILDEGLPIGAPAGPALGLADVIYEVSVTPNRADALSHLGIARVIAAYQGTEVRVRPASVPESAAMNSMAVQVRDPQACPRYLARVVRNVHVRPSPLWLQQRLESVGLRPRNVVVDITNLVLMECGHPLHAFDADVVHTGGIIVERATHGERFVTLDGKERELDSDMLMIRDAEKSLAVAGVMGGQGSAITDATRTVLIESAYFQPSSIRRTARRLGISSDASYRFERGTDIGNLEHALDRAAELMVELAGGEADAGFTEVYPDPLDTKPIMVRFARVRAVLGVAIDDDEITSRLVKVGCSVIGRDEASVMVRTPTYRVDFHEEIDLIEDIAIIGHYDSIPVAVETLVREEEKVLPSSFVDTSVKERLRRHLATGGFHEVVTQNQTDPRSDALSGGEGVALLNPLGEELSIMRSSLVPSLMRVVAHNVRQGAERIAVFEIGKTFRRTSAEGMPVDGIEEREEVCIAVSGSAHPKMWYGPERAVDFFDMKGVLQSLLQTIGCTVEFRDSADGQFTADQAEVLCDGESVGVFGYVTKDLLKNADCAQAVVVAKMSIPALRDAKTKERTYRRVSPFPTVQRDLAFIIDSGVPAESVRGCIEDTCGAILQGVRVFDVFAHASLGEGKKSCAYRLTFGSPERTLTDIEVDEQIRSCVQAVEERFLARLRA
ncbi:MAG: phenylalanine--tRNA ligase subunit beta [Candidatus Kapaibacterium sp.]